MTVYELCKNTRNLIGPCYFIPSELLEGQFKKFKTQRKSLTRVLGKCTKNWVSQKKWFEFIFLHDDSVTSSEHLKLTINLSFFSHPIFHKIKCNHWRLNSFSLRFQSSYDIMEHGRWLEEGTKTRSNQFSCFSMKKKVLSFFNWLKVLLLIWLNWYSYLKIMTVCIHFKLHVILS